MGGKGSKPAEPAVDLGSHLSQRKLAEAIKAFVTSHGETFGLLQRLQRIDRVISSEPAVEFAATDEDQGAVWDARFCVLAWLDDTADDGAIADDGGGGGDDDGEEGDFVFTLHVKRGQYTCLAAERA
eukprot:SAG31_NODE_2097_length_6453_cov_16.072867_4_plen_127_part_00